MSTNSITQGEQVSAIFRPLCERFNIHIDFAHTTFIWDNEASGKAHVHVVVIGFNSMNEPEKLKRLYTPEGLKTVEHINFYLEHTPDIFINRRNKPICENAPEMTAGNMPADGGNLLLTTEEKDKLLKREPKAKKFIKRFMMGNEFINNIPRYCLWLVNATPQEIKNMPAVLERVKAVREFRLASKKLATQKKAGVLGLGMTIQTQSYTIISSGQASTKNNAPKSKLPHKKF